MSKAYRYWNGFEYITKFEVEDEEHPKEWALRMQSKGYSIEVGNMEWDERRIRISGVRSAAEGEGCL